MTHNEDGAFSSIDLVYQCLIDKEKAAAFESAVKHYITPNSIVLDIGTGSGILALLAVRAGAKKVYALEYDSLIAETARKNVAVNNHKENVQILQADARTTDFPTEVKFDMVIMEMLTTGMVDEYQVQAINNLYSKGVVSDETIFIPAIQETYIQIADTNQNNYGFTMPMIRHFWKHDHNEDEVKPLSNETLLNAIDFKTPINENFSATIELEANKDGKVNSVFLTSKTILIPNQNIYLGSTNSLNASVSVPIEPFEIKAGRKIKLQISYWFGGGYRNFKVVKI